MVRCIGDGAGGTSHGRLTKSEKKKIIFKKIIEEKKEKV